MLFLNVSIFGNAQWHPAEGEKEIRVDGMIFSYGFGGDVPTNQICTAA